MSDPSFNPYLEWLGIDAADSELNHYQLLSLDPAEDDLEKIRRVAKARINLVRHQDPGSHRAEWKELLYSLQAAGLCLTNPRLKADYDRLLESQDSQEQSIPSSSSSAPVAAPPNGQPIPMAIPVATPVTSSADAIQNANQASGQMTEPKTDSDPAQTSTDREKHSTFESEQDTAVEFSPYKPSVTLQHRQRRKKSTVVTAATLIVLTILGAAAWTMRGQFATYFANRSSELNEPSKQKPAKQTDPSTAAPQDKTQARPSNGQTSGSTFMPQLDSDTAKGMNHTAADTTPQSESNGAPPTVPGNQASAESAPDNSSTVPAEKPEQTDEPTPSATGGEESPNSASPKKENPGDSESIGPIKPTANNKPSKSSPTDERQLRQSLSSAFQAMKERQQDQAAEHLRAAEALAIGNESRPQVESMQALHQALGHFWQAVEKAMTGLASGHELTVGETPVMVVESETDRILIRFRGQNREYSPADLPSGLAFALAESRLKKNSGNTNLTLGAFRLVDRDGDVDSARELWRRATESGENTEKYLPLLDFAASSSSDDSPEPREMTEPPEEAEPPKKNDDKQ